MPRHSRALVKTAMLWLVLGMALWAASAAPRLFALPGLASALRPSALHAVTVGWLTQLVMGVAVWLFPRPRSGPGGGRPATRPAAVWTAYGLLNAGLAARVATEPFAALGMPGPWRAPLVASGVLQWTAVMLFAGLLWPRVRGS